MIKDLDFAERTLYEIQWYLEDIEKSSIGDELVKEQLSFLQELKTFIQHQEKEKQELKESIELFKLNEKQLEDVGNDLIKENEELKEQLGKWKPKFDVGQIFYKNDVIAGLIEIKIDCRYLSDDTWYYSDDNNELWTQEDIDNCDFIFLTKEEAEQAIKESK